MYSKHKRFRCGVNAILDSSRWIKLTPGLDDFRKGPPTVQAGRIVASYPLSRYEETPFTSYASEPSENDFSSILSLSFTQKDRLRDASKASSSITRTSSIRSRLSSRSPLLRKTVRSRSKKREIDTLEQKVKANPLLLIPYLESDLPHEVFEKLIGILCPGHSPKDESVLPESKVEDTVTPLPDDVLSRRIYSRGTSIGRQKTKISIDSSSTSPSVVQQAVQHLISGDMEDQTTIQTLITEQLKEIGSVSPKSVVTGSVGRQAVVMDPYRSFLKRVNFSSTLLSKKTKKITPVKIVPEEELNVRELAEDFCKWLVEMGGEENKFNMDVDKILTLFAMDADIGATMMLITNYVLDEFPLTEEDVEAQKYQKTLTSKLHAQERLKSKKEAKEAPSKPFRYRYGAWYLDFKEWKKLAPGEKLEDPEELESKKRIENALCSDRLDDKIRNLHTFKSLVLYCQRYGIKMPHFLKNVPIPVPSSEESMKSKVPRFIVHK